jgi:hypothetical protein
MATDYRSLHLSSDTSPSGQVPRTASRKIDNFARGLLCIPWGHAPGYREVPPEIR